MIMQWRSLQSLATILLLVVKLPNTLSSEPLSSSIHPSKMALVVDIDNTLYQETHAGIERQIVDNTHAYCQEHLQMSSEQADDLFHEYGSTIEGLRQTVWKDIDEKEQKLAHYYEQVYKDIDMSKLLPPSSKGRGSSTGYTHGQEQRLIRRLFESSPNPIVWASNSPSWHVRNVIRGMGLSKIRSAVDMITPDLSEGFPTKHAAEAFFGNRLEEYHKLIMLDDSKRNLEQICSAFKNAVGVRISHDAGEGLDLLTALLQHWRLIDPHFTMDSIKYLQSKNVVDRQSIHKDTWDLVIETLKQTARERTTMPLEIVDVGAGLLSMLDLFLNGDRERDLSSLLSSYEGIQLHYTAYESNRDLWKAIQNRLRQLGFMLEEQIGEDDYLFTHPQVRLRMLLRDFDDEKVIDPRHVPDLIVGCCFADLMDPYELVPSLIRRFHLQGSRQDTLLYFPITFCGTTQFMIPQPFETDPAASANIPSDTLAFQLYSRALSETLGHNLDHRLLIQAMEDYGFTVASKGRSNWNIDASSHSYLYETMLYFFGSSAGPELLEEGWDAGAWIQRARANRPTIIATNTDILFKVAQMTSSNRDCVTNEEAQQQYEEIQFVAPREVTTVQRKLPEELGPNEVLVKSDCSLISSGTELKIYNGLFDDAALDVNIKGMQDERMAYPLSYGYCLVGRIAAVGSNISSDEVGKLVFTFSAHASHVVTDVEAVQFVPDGIDAKDAIFMPAVETALSLVHDANVRVGENVAVYGQGLIGLLVTKLLSLHNKSRGIESFGTITTFDTLADRLAASSEMGASQALLPGGSQESFDVSIEVSGNFRALQSAIDQTSNGGRVIVGSWYGNKDVSLKLGIDFHRSHKIIQTSQVSEIPATMLGLWDKERRFNLSWELVRQIRPSGLLTRTTTLAQAGEAYAALQNGSDIAIAFTYP